MNLIDTVKKHQKKSDGAFKLFNDTIKKLTVANKAIDVDIDKAEVKAAKAALEATELNAIKEKNIRFNTQLEKLMNEDSIQEGQ